MAKKRLSKLGSIVVSLAVAGAVTLFSTKDDAQAKSKSFHGGAYSSTKTVFYDTDMSDDQYGRHNGTVDYYTLALSWSPGFCKTQKGKYQGKLPKRMQRQCNLDDKYGWVIHGLWPQSKGVNRSEQPRFCKGDLPALPENDLTPYLKESPSLALLQGEWEKHGACSFNEADDYFNMQRALYNQLKLPKEKMSRAKLFRWMRSNNPQLDGVYMNATKNELFICYDKKWQPMSCPKQH